MPREAPLLNPVWPLVGIRLGSWHAVQAETRFSRDPRGVWVGTRLPPVCWSMDHSVSWFPRGRGLIPRAELTEQKTAAFSDRSLFQLKHGHERPPMDEGSIDSLVLLDRLRNGWCLLFLGWHTVCLGHVLPNQSEARFSWYWWRGCFLACSPKRLKSFSGILDW